ncbi:MAG: phosphate propanoyltransferase [Deltaproteobacteria bacterium]|nr:phosphate propanoyltransferase [Deltaproteobacteria bacterium]
MATESQIPINASVRHIHLSHDHVTALFGAGHKLSPIKDLSQPEQYAAAEVVNLVGPKSTIQKVRVLGPERKATQVEISRTDEFTLGVDAPVRASGHLEGTPGIRLEGPTGIVELETGLIQAQRHIHMSPQDAERFGVDDKDWVMVRVGGERGIIFDDVLVRVSPHYRLDMHLDTDEANAADLGPGATGTLIKGPATVEANPND